MDNCTIGALNTQSIDELKKQTIALFSMQEHQTQSVNAILLTVKEIKINQENEIEHRKRLEARVEKVDCKIGKHVDESADRIDAIKSNTAFRKCGVWVIGTVTGLIGLITGIAIKLGG